MKEGKLQEYKQSQENITHSYIPKSWKTEKKKETFLETYNFPRLNQEDTKNMKRPIANTEVESVIKN